MMLRPNYRDFIALPVVWLSMKILHLAFIIGSPFTCKQVLKTMADAGQEAKSKNDPNIYGK